VLVRAEHGFTANLPLEDFGRDGNLFAYRYDGRELEPDHGWPLRLVVPHLYFWKSVKWVRGFTVLPADEPGFWERNGYHMYGDPWREQRYWGD
jgi:DMSO/TMAO reductase YedYZ molybdopterin-dependent catalytic subunit